MNIIRADIFAKYPLLVFGMSTRNATESTGNATESTNRFGFNMSMNVGDVPDRVLENRTRFFSALGIGAERLAFPLQHHTSNVRIAEHPGTYEHCDALITTVHDVYIGITVADCVPITMYDPVTNTVVGVHAGWRGTASKIVKRVIAKLLIQCGSKPSNLRVYIGPSAGMCCYEVGVEVAMQFPASVAKDHGNGKFLLDVKEANRTQLIQCGVPEDQIEVSPDCTICTPDVFHSYRRENVESGRMMAVIGVRGGFTEK